MLPNVFFVDGQALKKVAELKDAVAEVVNGEGDGGKNVEDKVTDSHT